MPGRRRPGNWIIGPGYGRSDVNIPKTRHDQADIQSILGLNRPGGSRLWAWRRYGLWAALAAVLLLGVYALVGSGGGPALRYVTEPASRGSLTVIVTATGTAQPTNKVDVSSELSGTVRRVMVDYNSTVKVGDLLAELETDKLNATVESSRAKLVSARAHIEQARATVEETRLVYERKGRWSRPRPYPSRTSIPPRRPMTARSRRSPRRRPISASPPRSSRSTRPVARRRASSRRSMAASWRALSIRARRSPPRSRRRCCSP